MAMHQDFWHRYFADFMTCKLKLADPSQDSQSDIAQQLLQAYFSYLHDKEMPLKLVELHCHISISHHFLAQMATIFRSLNKMEKVQISNGVA